MSEALTVAHGCVPAAVHSAGPAALTAGGQALLTAAFRPPLAVNALHAWGCSGCITAPPGLILLLLLPIAEGNMRAAQARHFEMAHPLLPSELPPLQAFFPLLSPPVACNERDLGMHIKGGL